MDDHTAGGHALVQPRIIIWSTCRRKGIVCKLDKLELVETVYYFVNHLDNPFPPTSESKGENTVFVLLTKNYANVMILLGMVFMDDHFLTKINIQG